MVAAFHYGLGRNDPSNTTQKEIILLSPFFISNDKKFSIIKIIHY